MRQVPAGRLRARGSGQWPSRNAQPSALPHGVYVEYIGPTALTAYGPVTRRRYRFTGPGAVVAVDPRDAEILSTAPVLRRLR